MATTIIPSTAGAIEIRDVHPADLLVLHPAGPRLNRRRDYFRSDGRCAAYLGPGSGHKVVERDPLTITPSIDCPECGWHVTITDGAVV